MTAETAFNHLFGLPQQHQQSGGGGGSNGSTTHVSNVRAAEELGLFEKLPDDVYFEKWVAELFDQEK